MKYLPRIVLQNERDLAKYVVRTSILCVSIALMVDVANQLIFFASWPSAVRSWIITTVVVVAIAVPIAHKIGKTQVALYRASTIDELTGLLNRRAFLEEVGSSSFLALIIVDVDHFKRVNDRYGHWVGDQVLRATASMMQQSIGQIGRLGRLGGEEFGLLAQGRDYEEILSYLDIFRKNMERTPVLTDKAAITVTISAGVAMRIDGQTFRCLFVRADQALYKAKSLGRNNIVLADDVILDSESAGAKITQSSGH